ncbi:hypothetical protein RBB50_004153 [Rhinocladiella similis]
MATSSPFWRDIDITHTALLLSDAQTQLVAHMPEDEQHIYLTTLKELLDLFRTSISGTRNQNHHGGGPCIVHHVVVMDYATRNLSPTNKLNNWALKRLKASGAGGAVGPTDPAATVPSSLHPSGGWNMDEFVLTKQAPSCFMSSSLLKILHARDIKHVVLVGLTTEGSILSSVWHGSDLDFHIVVPREGVWCDDRELGEVVLEKLVPRFADVCSVQDVKELMVGSK